LTAEASATAAPPLPTIVATVAGSKTIVSCAAMPEDKPGDVIVFISEEIGMMVLGDGVVAAVVVIAGIVIVVVAGVKMVGDGCAADKGVPAPATGTKMVDAAAAGVTMGAAGAIGAI